MIYSEKLSLFNIDIFRKMYDEQEDSYICDKSFFEMYDNESFIVKYIIRRQVKLLKYKEKYIGYIWHEYPISNNQIRIYAINLDEEYLRYINRDILIPLNGNSFIFDIFDNDKHKLLMEKLIFNCKLKTFLMELPINLSYFNENDYDYKIRSCKLNFKKFKCNVDEELRCSVQNNVFKDKNRISIKVEDIYEEENEDYFIEDLCVFLNNNEGKTIGYGQVILYKGLYIIANFGILEEYRSNGYGEILLNYLLCLCKKKFINKVYIRVEKNNFKALSLYKKVGFKICKEYTTYVG